MRGSVEVEGLWCGGDGSLGKTWGHRRSRRGGGGEGRSRLVRDGAEFCILITPLAECFYSAWGSDKGAEGVARNYLSNSEAEKEYSRLEVRKSS